MKSKSEYAVILYLSILILCFSIASFFTAALNENTKKPFNDHQDMYELRGDYGRCKVSALPEHDCVVVMMQVSNEYLETL